MTGPDAITQRIAAAIEPCLSKLGLDLEAVEVSPAGKRRLLRIAVDADGGVTMDDVADATREIGEVLDAEGVMGEQPYTLEVTSRGVDRPLTLPRHWRRNVGRLVKVTLGGGEVVTGRVTGSGEDSVQFDVSGAVREIALADVTKALVQIEFNRVAAADLGDDSDADEKVEG